MVLIASIVAQLRKKYWVESVALCARTPAAPKLMFLISLTRCQTTIHSVFQSGVFGWNFYFLKPAVVNLNTFLS